MEILSFLKHFSYLQMSLRHICSIVSYFLKISEYLEILKNPEIALFLEMKKLKIFLLRKTFCKSVCFTPSKLEIKSSTFPCDIKHFTDKIQPRNFF